MKEFTTEDVVRQIRDLESIASQIAVEVKGSEDQRFMLMSRAQYDLMRAETRKVVRLEDVPDEMLEAMIAELEAYAADEAKPE